MRFLICLFLFSSFAIHSSFAARTSIFKAKTDDLTVNDACEAYKPAFFLQEKIDYFLVGAKGLKRAGFDEEISLSRGNATLLWKVLNPHSTASQVQKALLKVSRNKTLSEYLKILEIGRIERGADYYSEGEILEVLSYEYLPESDSFRKMLDKHFLGEAYSEEDFFITGGVKYFSKSGQTVGELDVIVGDSNTCTIFAIGEAKLGGKKSKAVRQLDRFAQFLRAL